MKRLLLASASVLAISSGAMAQAPNTTSFYNFPAGAPLHSNDIVPFDWYNGGAGALGFTTSKTTFAAVAAFVAGTLTPQCPAALTGAVTSTSGSCVTVLSLPIASSSVTFTQTGTGAAAQTQSNLNLQRISIADFAGFDATGATDSAAAVQAAANYAATLSVGADIYVPAAGKISAVSPPTCYKLNTQVTVPTPATNGKTIRIIGDGQGSCFVNGAGMTTTPMFYVGGVSAPGVEFNFVIDGIGFRGAGGGKAVLLQNANNAKVKNSYFNNLTIPIDVETSYAIHAIGNTFHDTASYCIYLGLSNLDVIRDNFFINNSTSVPCVYFSQSVANPIIDSNTFEGGWQAIDFPNGSTAVHIVDNYFDVLTHTPYSSEGPVLSATIENNQANGSGNLSLANFSNTTFNGNSSFNQITIAGGATNLNAHGNNKGGTGSTIPDQVAGTTAGTYPAYPAVGSTLTSTVAPSAVSLVNVTPKTITSVSLSPGNYDCDGNVTTANPGGNITTIEGSISLTDNLQEEGNATNMAIATNNFFVGFPVPHKTFTISGSQQVFLVGTFTFSTTLTAGGTLTCKMTP